MFSACNLTSEIRPASETQSEQVAGMQRTLFATPEDAVERCAVRIAGQDEDILLVQINIQNLTKSEVMKSGLFEQFFYLPKRWVMSGQWRNPAILFITVLWFPAPPAEFCLSR